jgi:hypothetical protein
MKIKLKKVMSQAVLALFVFFCAGCLRLDPVDTENEVLEVRLESGEKIKVLDLDPDSDNSIRVAVHETGTGRRVTGADFSSTTNTVRVRQSGAYYAIAGLRGGGMGIITFTDEGKSAKLRVFVRNWKASEVYRHGLYADMTKYPDDGKVPYNAKAETAYRLITDSGFHYEAPDGLSRRLSGSFDDMVHADTPRETPGWHLVQSDPHIIQTRDHNYFAEEGIGGFSLNKEVFKFILHFPYDGDMVGGFADRQRLELKTMDNTTPPGQKNANDIMYSNGGGDTFAHRWKFRLPDDFRVSSEYTHIHQIKPEGGDSGNPTFTLTGRKLRTGREVLQLIYRGPIRDNGDPSVNWYPAQVPLEPFKGEWIYAEEVVTYDNPGTYRIKLVRIRDMKVLLEYIHSPRQYDETDPFVMYRKGNSYIRPKFGIYRRILHMTPFGLPNMEDIVREYWAEDPEKGVVVLYADIEMDKLIR